KLVDTYFEADLEQYIDDIDRILGVVAVQSPGIATTMVEHYGLRVSGVAELTDDLVSRFTKYADAAERHGFAVVSTPFRMALAFRQAHEKHVDVVDNLIENARRFPQKDKKAFGRALLLYQAAGKGETDSGK